MKQRMINSIAFGLKLSTMKSCLLGAPGCGKDRAKVVEMVEKMLSVEPTIEPKSNLWWRDVKVELPPRHHTPCPRGNNPEYAEVSDTVWLYYVGMRGSFAGLVTIAQNIELAAGKESREELIDELVKSLLTYGRMYHWI